MVPARDEEELIGRCLASLAEAANAVPHVEVDAIVVANGCRDRTALVARALDARVMRSERANVGAARRLGASAAILGAGADVSNLWIANTDADSTVPPDWLTVQLEEAERGADVFAGQIHLATVTDRVANARWCSTYLEDATAGHAHGANLGLRAETYVGSGGFRPLHVGEDVDLVDRLLRTGAAIAWSDRASVSTSARHRPRVEGGVGSDLRAAALVPEPPLRVEGLPCP